MPKLSRKDKKARGKQPEIRRTPVQVFESAPTMELRHMNCIICGMRAPVPGRIARKSDNPYGIESGPYVPMITVQHFGGSLPSPDGEMRHRAGIMYWDPPENLTAEDIEMLREKIGQAQDLLGGLSLAPSRPVKTPPSLPQVRPSGKTEEQLVADREAKKTMESVTKDLVDQATKAKLVLKGGMDQKKDKVMDFWDGIYNRLPNSPAGLAYMQLTDDQRDSVLASVVRGLK